MARVTNSDKAVRTTTSAAITALGFVAAMAGLYFSRPVLIPLALALLFSFALTPLVVRLQRVGVTRSLSVVLVVMLAVGVMGGLAWLVSAQIVELASRLPNYKDNIQRKFDSLKGPNAGMVGRISGSLEEIGQEFSPAAQSSSSKNEKQRIVPVQVVQPPRSIMQAAQDLVGPLLKPLETLAIVVIFTIFMLLERESLRNRLLRLIGQGQLSLATTALNDAAGRVSKFLLMQALVNCCFGTLFGLGLFFIGVPNAFLFGVLAALFRFIPYVGTLSAAALPLILTLAVFDNWRPPLLTLGLFLVLELTIANVIEPWLYGQHTGISSLAILVAAVFWASLWGPVGLILSTPLTVCLVVIGRHVPHLQFLDILLGDEPVLLPAERFYQRLLALDVDEARRIVHEALKTRPVVEIYDEVIVAALGMAEQDRYRSELRDASLEFICQSSSEIVEELIHSQPRELTPTGAIGRRVLCFGAYDAADEITAAMLAHVAEGAGLVALPFSLVPPAVKVLEQFSSDARDIVCICALPPLAVMHARSMVREVREHFPTVSVLVCLWVPSQADVDRMEKLVEAKVVTTLAGASEELAKLYAPRAEPSSEPLLNSV